ncbi:hypothetical protein Q4E93_13120 [Flavitalea sp. BT771]|uniref:hypothetical protein n=1 Tax=Flavitalea sp. BT771 TaxID=3063329 RepID=UPI0026E264CC|nr:hypothetical protein [Flavitalea sp. BT771]MDO6431539.1 hypothetical protein [Flavitalea sp. BT771]MDV6220447.1 hypothetical protein [Flavitalea sp. BT771]
MKRVLPIMLLLLFMLYSFQACKKDQNNTNTGALNQHLIESAKRYFQDNLEHAKHDPTGIYRTDAAKSLDWQAAQVASLSNVPVVIVPVHYLKDLFIKTTFGGEKLFSLNEIVHLVIYKDKNNSYQAELVTAFPDTNALQRNANKFSGIIFVENWSGQRIHQFKLTPDGHTFIYNDQYGIQNKSSKISSSENPVQTDRVIANCTTIYGYNYAADDPDHGYAWSEPGGCWYMYIPDPLEAGGGGAGGFGGGGGFSGGGYGSIGHPSSPTARFATINRGPNTIASIQDYLKCFTNVGGTDHVYTVTLCIDQPVPGTREPWSFQNSPGASSAANNPFDVGHTFLVFSETYGGTTITRNVGFYPRTSVNPLYPSDQGQLNDNEGSSYNLSLTIAINNAQFFNMLNYVSQGNNPGYMYNLNSNNCTTFAINALQAGSVNLSTQIGTWFKGSGYNPGDLGEDVRNMPLSSNMSRSTVENSHPNVGNCN